MLYMCVSICHILLPLRLRAVASMVSVACLWYLWCLGSWRLDYIGYGGYMVMLSMGAVLSMGACDIPPVPALLSPCRFMQRMNLSCHDV